MPHTIHLNDSEGKKSGKVCPFSKSFRQKKAFLDSAAEDTRSSCCCCRFSRSMLLLQQLCFVKFSHRENLVKVVMCRLAEFRESLTHDSMGKILTRELTQSHDSRVVTRESNESTLESKVNEIWLLLADTQEFSNHTPEDFQILWVSEQLGSTKSFSGFEKLKN